MDNHRLRIGALAWSSSLLFSGSRDKTILQREIRAQEDFVSKLTGHKSKVCGLKWWSYDNRELASGGNDNRGYYHSTFGKQIGVTKVQEGKTYCMQEDHILVPNNKGSTLFKLAHSSQAHQILSILKKPMARDTLVPIRKAPMEQFHSQLSSDSGQFGLRGQLYGRFEQKPKKSKRNAVEGHEYD